MTIFEEITQLKSLTKEFKDDLESFDDAALVTEISEVDDKLDEITSWAEALTSETELRRLRAFLESD